jgi:DNA helicase-2/ATP-dependent DNA helicase PcrA
MYPGSFFISGLMSLLVLRLTNAFPVGSKRLAGGRWRNVNVLSRNFGHHAATTSQRWWNVPAQAPISPSKRLPYDTPLFPPPCQFSSSSSTTRRFSSNTNTDTEQDLNTPPASVPNNNNNNNNNKIDLSQHSTTSILLDGLNPAQIDAVTKPTHSITRVLAGPGSGKTRVLTCRVAYLLEQDRLGRVLAVTFTRKASGEMQSRVEKLLRQQHDMDKQNTIINENDNDNDYYNEDGILVVQQEMGDDIPKGLDRVTLGTFHSICAKILRYNGNLLASLPAVVNDMGQSWNNEKIVNLDGGFAILDQTDQLRLVRECLEEAGVDLKKSVVKPLSILTAIGQIKEALSQGLDPFTTNNKQGTAKMNPAMKIAKQLYYSYRERQFTNNAVDFDDLIFMTRELLMQHRDLRERLHRRWPHLLVDEFQDTSKTQMDLVNLLTSSSLFVVGDADQSIYSWRGAHAGSMDDFRSNYLSKGINVDTVYLKENYRSTSNIVRAAEKVISSDLSSSAPPRKSMKPERGKGPSPRVIACLDERAEANFVVDSILDMLDSQTITPQHTVAMIYRTNAQSRHLEEACVQKNLPYVIRGGAGGFYKRAEVKDCLCFLRWIYNGNDEGAMLRAIKTPSRGIGDVGMGQFKEYCDEVNLFHRENYPGMKNLAPLDVLISMTEGETGEPVTLLQDGAPTPDVFISKRAVNNFLPFSRQMRILRDKAHHVPVDKLLFSVIEEFDLVSHFDAISKSKAEFEERRENVQELRQATKRYSKGGAALQVQTSRSDEEEAFDNEPPLGNFLDDVALVTDLAAEKTDDNRLIANLMTIHGSKGMEFDAVFVVGNEEGTLPSNRAIQEGEDSIELAEEKRLCYVAMTRAKTQLCMTWRKEVTNFASWSDSGPQKSQKDRSRFLDALVSKKSGGGKSGPVPKRRKGPINVDQMLLQKRNYSTERAITEGRRAVGESKQKARPSRDYATRSATPRNNNNDRVLPSRDSNTPTASQRANSDRPRPPRERTTSPVSRRQNDDSAYLRDTEKRYVGDQRNGENRSLDRPAQARPRVAPQQPANGASSPRKNIRPPEPHGKIAQGGNPSNTNAGRNSGSRELKAKLSREVVVRKPSQTQKSATSVSPGAIRQPQDTPQGTSTSPKATTKPTSPERGDFDSTWLFPIGSSVTHKNFGKGTVLEPPSSGADKDMLVRVTFQNSERTMEFHVGGNAILPD